MVLANSTSYIHPLLPWHTFRFGWTQIRINRLSAKNQAYTPCILVWFRFLIDPTNQQCHWHDSNSAHSSSTAVWCPQQKLDSAIFLLSLFGCRAALALIHHFLALVKPYPYTNCLIVGRSCTRSPTFWH